jgi:hypothetical protein
MRENNVTAHTQQAKKGKKNKKRGLREKEQGA